MNEDKLNSGDVVLSYEDDRPDLGWFITINEVNRVTYEKAKKIRENILENEKILFEIINCRHCKMNGIMMCRYHCGYANLLRLKDKS